MTKINNIGDNGSPCLSPLLCSILSPGESLSSIWVEEVARRPLMISRHTCPKPNICSTSKRKGQDTESNALVISSFRRIRACFCWCRNFVVCYTNMKLSKMKCPLMKALWFGVIILSSRPASLFAISFVRSLAKECTRLIGLKSLMLVALSFFGRRVI